MTTGLHSGTSGQPLFRIGPWPTVGLAILLEVPGALLVALVLLQQLPPLLALPGMALVVVGDVVYVVVAATTTDPLLYAPPLMMLFTCIAAAW